MCRSIWLVCMCVYHMLACCPWMSDRAFNQLELELWMVVSHYVGAGNLTWVLLTAEPSLPAIPLLGGAGIAPRAFHRLR